MNSKIYLGEVMHARLMPVKHRFRYPVYFYAFQLDELPHIAERSLLFGYNRLRPVAIHDRDYLTPGPEPIENKLKTVLSQAGLTGPLGKTIMVTAARYFNYIFNPISFFYCYDLDDQLVCMVVQVNNTFGEMHLYLLQPKAATETSQGVFRLQVDKHFHVSPFFPRRGHYEFRLSLPGPQIDNTINYYLDEQLALVARIHGSAATLNPANLTKTVVTHPLSASLTMPRILWQAARLYWQRRLPVYHKPVPNNSMTVRPSPSTWLERLGMKIVLNFLDRLPEGHLQLETPDGLTFQFGVSDQMPALHLTVKEHRFFRRVMLAGDIGFGEAYTDGDWSTDNLPDLLTLLAAHQTAMDDRRLFSSVVGRLVNLIRHLQRPNTIRGSDRNIREHYDLSNAFFATFLDPSMTYSCALFDDAGNSLEQAQSNKLQKIIDKAGITAEDHVLEIGCGWGSFAIEAARQTGCRVTGLTISHEQLSLAEQKVREAGLDDRITICLCDYRHIQGQYSKIVSIEMLEAVGHSGLGPFFKACEHALLPGGRAVIQVITMPDRKYLAYRFSSDWIRKHIFPGGHLPSLGALAKAMAANSTLNIASFEHFGDHYAKTLDRWRQTLLARRQEILAMGYDEHFLRKWEYYFAYCRAGFAAKVIDLAQIVLDKPDHP
ncbi:MAG: DUF1365 family protein [Deltaproteobacteria bacterium]|jgi:cyclopropane-fatty-acyl-phospholipid synthase|nr:DUF1365 family protein [Deltaproteobacteria bacterium]